MTPNPRCPSCGSLNTVVAWDGDTKDGTPDYFGCFDCDADMVRLKDVEARLAEEFEA